MCGDSRDEGVADELRGTIVDPNDLVLYDEAQLCLEAGADRAAYIISWIAAAEGLLGKFRTMAMMHTALGRFVGSFEAAQRSGTAKDAELIAKAFEVGIINQPERTQLEAMRDLRNQYGHSTALAPSHASAAHALHTAVTTVLAKQALIMHGAAKDLAIRASTDRHLVPQDKTAIDAFTHSRAVVIHYDARPIFIRELLVGANRQLRDVNGELLADRCLRMAVIALQEWHEPLAQPRWNVDQMQQDFSAAAADVFSDPVIWKLLEEEYQNRILSYCLDSSTGAQFTRAPGRLLVHADRLRAEGLLTDSQRTRVHEHLITEDPWRLWGAGVSFEYVARGMIRELDDSSFVIAGEGVKVLRASRDSLSDLDEDLQCQIGVSLAYAANNNTFAAVNEVDDMAGKPDTWPLAVRAGVVVGALVGKWWPVTHPQTSKAALRIAISDPDGKLAQHALDTLTPDRTQVLVSPTLISEFRTILDGVNPTPAILKLREYLNRLDSDPRSV